ncbi:MAG: glycosyltransferase [Planctomycetaceae bacterium]|nr:glycosyltransferase [Planctomycetaceae bacterium]
MKEIPIQDGDDISKGNRVLWWSRSGRDYSRDRIVRQAFRTLGWQIEDFTPRISSLGDLEATLFLAGGRPDLVWVPCFRQRDARAAARWSKRRGIPVIFDPLISTYDKQVFERQKFVADSHSARKLLRWESSLFLLFDKLIADTDCHADFFHEVLGYPRERIDVIPVSAEEELFAPREKSVSSDPLIVLFYGSFIHLHGIDVIIEAASAVPEVQWNLLGDGPLRAKYAELAAHQKNVQLMPSVPYSQLQEQIGTSDILLGVFSPSGKAGRVIPNKVYQSLACGRPVITRKSPAYPSTIRSQPGTASGMIFVDPGNADALAEAVRGMAQCKAELTTWNKAARKTYETYFANDRVRKPLKTLLDQVSSHDRQIDSDQL